MLWGGQVVRTELERDTYPMTSFPMSSASAEIVWSCSWDTEGLTHK